jgi:putative endonuclease
MSDGRMNLGRRGEDAAATWYAEHGYTIVARNWRCAQGEIDLLCARRHPPDCLTLVVCEVKARSSHAYGHPLEAVTPAKARRLRRLAGLYLGRQSTYYDHVRFDVAGVDRHALEIYEDAF